MFLAGGQNGADLAQFQSTLGRLPLARTWSARNPGHIGGDFSLLFEECVDGETGSGSVWRRAGKGKTGASSF